MELLETEYEQVLRKYKVPRTGHFKIPPKVGGRVVFSKLTGLPIYSKRLTNATICVVLARRICLIIFYLILESIPARRSISSITPDEFKDIREPLRTPMFLELGGEVVGPVLERIIHWGAFMLYPFLAILWKYWRTRMRFDLRRSWMGPTLLYPLTGCVVGILKIIVGRPRPSMFSRCYGEDYLDYKDFSYACTGNETLIFDGMKSFPCKHTSLAFASATFLFLYLAGHYRIWAVVEEKSAAFLRLWPAEPKPSGFQLTILTVTPAFLVGVSRVVGNDHHIGDVMFGAMIGTILAFVVYFDNFPSLLSPMCYVPKGVGEDDLFELEHVDFHARYFKNPNPDPTKDANDPIRVDVNTSQILTAMLAKQKQNKVYRRIIETKVRAGNRNPTFVDET
ncbi:unnamed protein product [Orchesella dallaii]